MSALNWGIGDLLSVTKLACGYIPERLLPLRQANSETYTGDLYHNCYLVAREAPDDFRQLVNELASLQGVLRTLRDDVNSDKSFFERMGDNRKQMLERCLASCFETLHKLQKLVVKYRELGVADGLQFWKKLKWVSKQGEISELKSKIMVHSCNINLCMSSIGNSSLARMETSMMKALERQMAPEEVVDENDQLAPLQKSKTVPTAGSDLSEADDPGLGIRRQFTETTLVDQNVGASPDSTPSLSSEEAPEVTSTSPITPKHKRHWIPTTTGKTRTGGSFSQDRDVKAIHQNPMTYESAGVDLARTTARSRRLLSLGADSTTTEQEKPQNVDEVVAEAMKTLSLIRQKEQAARPLRIVRQDPQHAPDEVLKKKFQQLVDEELKIRKLNARDWLRVATWWLLKAQYNMRLEKPELSNTRASFSVSGGSKTPANQAYIDLLKSRWILDTIILREDNRSSLMTDENRKLFHTLSDGIREEFNEFEPVDEPDKDVLLDQNCEIWEFLQPKEETYDDDDLLPGLENGRWITVEQDDAGEEDETVIFRTFVNAALGGKASRVRSRGAPYMLILSTKEGESEPKVTLCNQSGTICLTRDITMDDLREPAYSEGPFSDPQLNTQNPVPLNFDRMSVAIAFTNDVDLDKFMRIPRAYFDAVRCREPQQLTERATETLIFKSSVEIFEKLNASTMQPTSPRLQYRSCDLRVLETTTTERWRTTRRLVISSSAAEKKPWCTEFFLPLSRVQINRQELPRRAMIKWSDCCHEKSDRTDGNYNTIYSYVYDDSNPNICLSLLFRNQADATQFEETVLKLSIPPVSSSYRGSEARYVHNITDTEPNPKNYKALMLVHTRLDWRYSELYYTFRDTDYVFDRRQLRVRFPQASYTDYISTHVDKLWKPEVKDRPHFHHCEKRIGNVSIDFEEEAVAQSFMSSLTSGYRLLFSRCALHITTQKPSKLRSTKSNKGSSEVQLWQVSVLARIFYAKS
ncbi:MAG: hypothetical protein Q9195_002191 [Heterodermia aff. obscurata]